MKSYLHPRIFAVLGLFLSLSFPASAQTEYRLSGGSLTPQAAALSPGSMSVSLNYDTHQLFLSPELVKTGTGLIPFIPGPFSVRIRQNILPIATTNYLEGIEYTTEVYVNGNNAPAVAGDVGCVIKTEGLVSWFPSLRISGGGVSSMETNAWRVRVSMDLGADRFLITLSGEAGVLLHLPENLLFTGLAASGSVALIRDTLLVTGEVSGSGLTRFSAGCSLSAYVRRVSFSAGVYYRRTPSSQQILPTFSIGILRN